MRRWLGSLLAVSLLGIAGPTLAQSRAQLGGPGSVEEELREEGRSSGLERWNGWKERSAGPRTRSRST
jgi:hypothetical protein